MSATSLSTPSSNLQAVQGNNLSQTLSRFSTPPQSTNSKSMSCYKKDLALLKRYESILYRDSDLDDGISNWLANMARRRIAQNAAAYAIQRRQRRMSTIEEIEYEFNLIVNDDKGGEVTATTNNAASYKKTATNPEQLSSQKLRANDGTCLNRAPASLVNSMPQETRYLPKRPTSFMNTTISIPTLQKKTEMKHKLGDEKSSLDGSSWHGRSKRGPLRSSSLLSQRDSSNQLPDDRLDVGKNRKSSGARDRPTMLTEAGSHLLRRAQSARQLLVGSSPLLPTKTDKKLSRPSTKAFCDEFEDLMDMRQIDGNDKEGFAYENNNNNDDDDEVKSFVSDDDEDEVDPAFEHTQTSQHSDTVTESSTSSSSLLRETSVTITPTLMSGNAGKKKSKRRDKLSMKKLDRDHHHQYYYKEHQAASKKEATTRRKMSLQHRAS